MSVLPHFRERFPSPGLARLLSQHGPNLFDLEVFGCRFGDAGWMLRVDKVVSFFRDYCSHVGSVWLHVARHDPSFRCGYLDFLACLFIDNEVSSWEDLDCLDGLGVRVVVVDVDFPRDCFLDNFGHVMFDDFVCYCGYHDLFHVGMFGFAWPKASWQEDISTPIAREVSRLVAPSITKG